MAKSFFRLIILLILFSPAISICQTDADFETAFQNGLLANEGFRRCHLYMEGWLSKADPVTGLIPRNLTGSNYWNAQDAAADNYPFMVLSAYLTDPSKFSGVMLDILNTEITLTSRIGSMPDTYDFTTQSLQENSLASVIFGSSEYVKDGLLPLTEWLGKSPWSDRMISIMDDIWAHTEVETGFGLVPSTSHEVAGELLQSLSRIFWMTGEQKYLDWALRLGDYFLLGNNHPTGDASTLRLRDHGNEVIAGLAELYATVSQIDPVKKEIYRNPIHQMLDKILEIGRNSDGFLYDEIYPQSGTHSSGLADTWGYVLNAHYTVYLIDGTREYRNAVIKALESTGLPYYTNTHRFGEIMDGYADAIESALNLYNREYTGSAEIYMDSSIQKLWNLQQPDGIIEGWYGDGNFARTSVMYCLWKTQGLTIRNWDQDVIFGAVPAYNFDSPEPSDITVNSSNKYEIVKNGTDTGVLIYTDRNYVLTQIPEYLLTETIIRTACNDKNVSLEELITFTAPADILVYVAVDKRVTKVPDWLANWNLTGDELDTSLDDLEFSLYGNSFTKGTTVTLGGPQATGFQGYASGGNYLVFIMEDNPPADRPVKSKNTLKVSLRSASDWEGKLVFDAPRHKTHMNLPFNWARINQFPEWYVVEKDSNYTVRDITLNSICTYKGSELSEGIDVVLKKDQEQQYTISLSSDADYATRIEDPGSEVTILHTNNDTPFKVYFYDQKLIIDFKKPSGIITVNIYDVSGNLIKRCSNERDDKIYCTVNGRTGIYIIQGITNQAIYSEKSIMIP
jgi:hypothetical protein